MLAGAETSWSSSFIAIRISDGGGGCSDSLQAVGMRESTYVAGVQAASEAALLLDFLGHVCCGVSRRRPLPGKRGQRFEKRRAACEFLRQNSACDFEVRPRQAFLRFLS